MNRTGSQRSRVVPFKPGAPLEPMVRSVTAADWDDTDEAVDFQDDTLDDTVNVAAEALEAAAAAEKQGTMANERTQSGGDTSLGATTGSGPTRLTAEGRGAGAPPFELAAMIRVAGDGVVVTNKGGSEDLAGVVAYTHRLVELVGDLLGLEGFRALECVFRMPDGTSGGKGADRCLLFTEANGDTVLVRPRAEGDLQALRERLGL
jgi:hypothetical protein